MEDPIMDGLYGRSLFKWMMTRGNPIYGNPQLGATVNNSQSNNSPIQRGQRVKIGDPQRFWNVKPRSLETITKNNIPKRLARCMAIGYSPFV